MAKVVVRPLEDDALILRKTKGLEMGLTFSIDAKRCHLEDNKTREAIRKMFAEHFAREWGLPVVIVEFGEWEG